MSEFLILFIYRVISGVQNSYGYSGRGMSAWTMALLVIAGFVLTATIGNGVYQNFHELRIWQIIIAVPAIVASGIGAYYVQESFTDPEWRYADIHLWELVCTSGIWIAVAVQGDIVASACSVYPGLILHKGFINLGTGQRFWYEGTDDSEGRYWSIPLLGIKVPRLGLRFRLVAAAISVAVVVLQVWLGILKFSL